MNEDAAPDEGTTQVYDISGPNPVLGDMPHSQVHDAIASGRFSFPKGTHVAVVAPDGQHGTIPADQAPDALNSGYQYATPAMQKHQADIDQYTTPKQQFVAGVEGLGKGLAGFLAPAAERLLGASPEGIRKREELNPWTHGISEAVGFGAGMFTGASEARLLAKAGEAAVHAAGLANRASIAGKIASGSVRAGTEMALLQGSDEAAKAITQDPKQSVGSAAIHVGLSGLLGTVGGGFLTGTGLAAKAGIKATGLDSALKEFTDRMSYRGANLNPNEAMHHELDAAVNGYHELGSEIGGSQGVKAQALAKLLPEMNPAISDQVQGIVEKAESAIARLGDDPLAKKMREELATFKSRIAHGAEVPSVSMPEMVSPNYEGIPESVFKAPRPFPQRLAQMSEREGTAQAENLSRANAAGFNPYDLAPKYAPASSHQVFDAMQGFKRQLQEWGEFSKIAPPPIGDRAFISASKGLAHDMRLALERPEVWGRAAELQTKLNKAWSEAIPFVEQIESQFMSKVGRDRIVDPAKFMTYVRQNDGRIPSLTIRQQRMSGFVNAIEKFQDASRLAYDRAGIEYPHAALGLGALKDSVSKKSPWAKLADLSYDRLAPHGAGEALGGAAGFGIGHATGIPEAGFVGGYLGKWVLGPVFSAVIKPLMIKSLNSGALEQALKFSDAVLKGNSQLLKSSTSLFSAASKTVPQHFMPDIKGREKLDKQLQYAAANPSSMFGVGGDLGHYMPQHQSAVAEHAQTAVSYLNGMRPQVPKQAPLDTQQEPSKGQTAEFHRQLDIAQQPLMVLQHMANGKLQPKDVQTLKTIYPNLYQKMALELQTKLAEHVSKGETVPYRLRQGMSLFLAQPMDSTMTPASLQAIQSHFGPANRQETTQAAAAAQPAKSTQKLGHMATAMQTQSQSRESRSNKA